AYAVMSVMIGGVVDQLAPDSNFEIWNNVTNSSIIDTVARDKERVQIAATVTFISGLFQPPAVPAWSIFVQIIGNAFALAVVGYGIAISLGRIFALKYGYKVDSNQVV
ncbi:hypothetical protein GOODEAATRI_023219, partial [Goodea atripinnis]